MSTFPADLKVLTAQDAVSYTHLDVYKRQAVGTPAAIAAAAAVAAGAGMMSAAEAQAYKDIASIAALQVSISTLSTAIMCPIAVILIDKWQRSRGIDGKLESIEIAAMPSKQPA